MSGANPVHDWNLAMDGRYIWTMHDSCQKYWIGLLFALAVACGGSKETTQAGLVGAPEDLRSKLKPDVMQRAPTNDKAERHEVTADIHGVGVKLVWWTFTDGPNKFVLSTQWEVVKPHPSITIEPIPSAGMMPTNAGTETAVNETVIVRVRWHDNGSSVSTNWGEQSFRVDGNGSGTQI